MNISDNINKNEQLFWKVIHNKFIFNLIFEKIHEISNEIEETHNIKSYKFKDIKSMSWMIEYRAFNLLIYKLSKNETIEIKENSIQSLVGYIIEILGYGHNVIPYEQKLKKQKVNQEKVTKQSDEENKFTKSTRMLIYEIIELLLKNYSLYLLKYDIIIQIFHNLVKDLKNQQASLELIRTLVCKPYSIVLTPHHFKLVILNFKLDFIKEFITIANQSNCNIADQDFKDHSLLIVLNIEENNYGATIDQQVLKFILDNPQYHSQSYDQKFIPQERDWPFMGSCNGYFIPYYLNTLIDHDATKRDISSFFKLDQELQIKLLSLKFYNTHEWFYFERSLCYSKNNLKDLAILRKQRDDANQFIYDINCNSDHLDPISKINAINHFFKDYIKMASDDDL